ncbi:MAG: hypothetical protein SGBAC_008703 [Bacillariaceae sp.]
MNTPSGSRSPRTPKPTWSPKGKELVNPNGKDGKPKSPAGGQRGQRESSWLGNAWNAFTGTPKSSQQSTPTSYKPSHLQESASREVHSSLMVPQVEDVTTPIPSYRIQPRSHPTLDDDDEDVLSYMKKSSKQLTPLRNRSPMVHYHSRTPTTSATGTATTGPPKSRTPTRNSGPPMLPKMQQKAPLSPYRQPNAPVPTLSSSSTSAAKSASTTSTTSTTTPSMEKSSIRSVFFGTVKRRAAFWTVLSIMVMGPTVMIGGYLKEGFVETNHPDLLIIESPEIESSIESMSDNNLLSNDNSQRSLYSFEADTFMVQDQSLNAGESKPVASDSRIALKQQRDGNLVLYKNNKAIWSSGINKGSSSSTAYVTYLQGDGNLITRSMAFSASQMTWVTSVVWQSNSRNGGGGQYLLMLTQNSDGLMIVRRSNSKIVWSTVDNAKLDAPIPQPTRRPTPQPVEPPRAVPRPASIPYVPAPPGNSPPSSFPWPNTVARNTRYTIQSGPMVGHTTHNSAKFWVYLGQPGVTMQLVYWRQNGGSQRSVNLVPDSAANNAAIRTITGLQSNTVYLYEIRIDNKWLSQGHFKTAPRADRATSFKYVLASCMNVKSNTDGYINQPVWNEVAKKDVDFAMLAGDTIYLDWRDWNRAWVINYSRIWYRYLQQRSESNFARFIKTIPTYGTWDNHDYGHDYGDHEQAGKENSLAAWSHLWPLPYQGSNRGRGNYYSFSWGDVDFFVMDCRWYRNWDTGILFGNQQLAWLEDELSSSSATFKIIVSASDVMANSMSADLKKIGRIVTRHSVSGVVFNSGDIHRNEYKSQTISGWPYRVHQFTSSGIAVVWRRNFAIVNVDTTASDPSIRVQFHAAESPSRSTNWRNDGGLKCSDIDGKNRNRESRCTQTVRLSQLRA